MRHSLLAALFRTGPRASARTRTRTRTRTGSIYGLRQQFCTGAPLAHQRQDLAKMMKLLPPKPEPPSDGDCCLSGCEFCVWDLYDEDMREYQKQAGIIRQAFEDQGKEVPEQIRPENLRDLVDPTMRAFLDMEREMAMKIEQEGQEHNDDESEN